MDAETRRMLEDIKENGEKTQTSVVLLAQSHAVFENELKHLRKDVDEFDVTKDQTIINTEAIKNKPSWRNVILLIGAMGASVGAWIKFYG